MKAIEELHITIVDYGMGNIKSVTNALGHIGCTNVRLSSDPKVLNQSDALFLPGVGAFRDAITHLKQNNLLEVLNEIVLEKKKPIMAICLGMQLLFDESEEGGTHKGLGWIPGKVKKFKLPEELRSPHIGWNELFIKNTNQGLFKDFQGHSDFYFVHGYHANCDDTFVEAYCEYGEKFPAAVRRGNIFGTQYHPEKSQNNGMKLLSNFFEMVCEGTAYA